MLYISSVTPPPSSFSLLLAVIRLRIPSTKVLVSYNIHSRSRLFRYRSSAVERNEVLNCLVVPNTLPKHCQKNKKETGIILMLKLWPFTKCLRTQVLFLWRNSWLGAFISTQYLKFRIWLSVGSWVSLLSQVWIVSNREPPPPFRHWYNLVGSKDKIFQVIIVTIVISSNTELLCTSYVEWR